MELERLVCPLVRGSRSPKDGPQICLHPESPPVDWLVAETALLVPHLLLAGPAQQVARDTLRDLGRHLLETDGTLRLYNVAVIIFG